MDASGAIGSHQRIGVRPFMIARLVEVQGEGLAVCAQVGRDALDRLACLAVQPSAEVVPQTVVGDVTK